MEDLSWRGSGGYSSACRMSSAACGGGGGAGAAGGAFRGRGAPRARTCAFTASQRASLATFGSVRVPPAPPAARPLPLPLPRARVPPRAAGPGSNSS
ncbi:unnamed protein product, partial [Iphiclides podalirius]